MYDRWHSSLHHYQHKEKNHRRLKHDFHISNHLKANKYFLPVKCCLKHWKDPLDYLWTFRHQYQSDLHILYPHLQQDNQRFDHLNFQEYHLKDLCQTGLKFHQHFPEHLMQNHPHQVHFHHYPHSQEQYPD